jgi:hypothetical protein
MTGLFRLIIMSIIAYIVYAVIRRFLRPLMSGTRKTRPQAKEKYSRKDGAIDAEYEEVD